MTAKPQKPSLLVAIGEAAAMLHCSNATVRRLVKQGALRGLSLGGASGAITRVTVESLRAFIARANGSVTSANKGGQA